MKEINMVIWTDSNEKCLIIPKNIVIGYSANGESMVKNSEDIMNGGKLR